MTNGRDLVVAMVRLWAANRAEDAYYQCQRISGFYMQWAYQGNEDIYVYGSAEIAADNSTMRSNVTRVNDPDIQPGDELFFWYGDDGHVVTAVGWDGGRLIVVDTSRKADVIEDFGYGIHLSHADTISLTFRGASAGNGANVHKQVDAYILGAVDEQVVHGFQRKVSSSGVYRRAQPNTSGSPMEEFLPGEVLDFAGWIRGEDPYGRGNNIWFKGRYSETYFYSGAFEDQDIHDLVDLNPKAPTDPVQPPIVLPPYTFVKDLACVTEVLPAHTSNFQYGNFPIAPAKIVMHDFGTKGLNTYESVREYFQLDHTNDPDHQVSAHFVVSGDDIVQMVSLHDRAWHSGPKGNDFIGIEIDPVVGSNLKSDQDLKNRTIASVRKLLTQLRDHYTYNPIQVKHSDILATTCGDDIDLSLYKIADIVVTPTEPTTPTVPTTPTKPEEPEMTDEEKAQVELDKALEEAKDKLPDLEKDIENLQDQIDPRSAFAGLFDKYPKVRFWMYLVFAAFLLLLSLIPDAIQAGIVPREDIPWLTDWTYFLTSVGLKIGVAFGFIAASNTSKTKKN